MRAALQITGLPSEGEVRTRFPTTHVAALVGDRYLVKLHYEDWFGESCFQSEREGYAFLRGSGLPIPELLAEGSLYPPEGPGWRWPFLVMTVMPGRDLRSLGAALTREDLERCADFVGDVLGRLHDVPVHDAEHTRHDAYVELIRARMAACARDHRAWASLPPHMVEEVRDYVWEAHHLIDPDREPPVLIHGDLHGGNLFVTGEPGFLTPVGIVDFNDIYLGDRHYDLVAVHLRALQADKRLLRRALDAYGWGRLEPEWPRRMLAQTLTHDYDLIRPVVDRFPSIRSVATLDELAARLWDLDAPGLR